MLIFVTKTNQCFPSPPPAMQLFLFPKLKRTAGGSVRIKKCVLNNTNKQLFFKQENNNFQQKNLYLVTLYDCLVV